MKVTGSTNPIFLSHSRGYIFSRTESKRCGEILLITKNKSEPLKNNIIAHYSMGQQEQAGIRYFHPLLLHSKHSDKYRCNDTHRCTRTSRHV